MSQQNERRKLEESEESPFLRSCVKKGRTKLRESLEGDVGADKALLWKTIQHVATSMGKIR